MKNCDTIYVTKTFCFDMAHALVNYDGPCRNIHGHTYHLRVTVSGTALQEPGHPKDGMLVDFSELKSIVNQQVIHFFDHALVLNANSPHRVMEVLQQQHEKIHLLPYQPTCENLLLDIRNRLLPYFQGLCRLYALRLDETPTSYAEWINRPLEQELLYGYWPGQKV